MAYPFIFHSMVTASPMPTTVMVIRQAFLLIHRLIQPTNVQKTHSKAAKVQLKVQ